MGLGSVNLQARQEEGGRRVYIPKGTRGASEMLKEVQGVKKGRIASCKKRTRREP